jgi:hypothetical protein
MKHPMIRVGDTTVWLDAKALRRGEVRVSEKAVSEQCAGCGADIADGQVDREEASVLIRCACGAVYPVTAS